jgi:hypothetical protein
MAGASQERTARKALGQQGSWGWWGVAAPLRPVIEAGARRVAEAPLNRSPVARMFGIPPGQRAGGVDRGVR